MEARMKKIKAIIFISGRGSNMESIIRSSQYGNLKEICEIVGVVSDKVGIPGLTKARALAVPCFIVESRGKSRETFDYELISLLKPLAVDYIILAGFNRILSPVLISQYKDRIINIHPADSRVYQGLHGYQWAYENHLENTKITVHLVDEGIDTGKIIDQREFDLSWCSSIEEIEHCGLAIENIFYSEVLEKYFKEKLRISL
jgi:phosphoribosylglycinamide formyltransferase-1